MAIKHTPDRSSSHPAAGSGPEPCYLTYETADQYAQILSQYVRLEREYETENCETRAHEVIVTRFSDRGCTIRAPIRVLKTITLGATVELKTGAGQTIVGHASRRSAVTIAIEFPSSIELTPAPRKLALRLLPFTMVFDRQLAALTHFSRPRRRTADIHPVIRAALLGDVDTVLNSNTTERILTVVPPLEGPNLNDSQVHAASLALNRHFSSIQGPPGTGKTTVIAAIAHSFVKQGYRVLLLAHTNVAADHLALMVARTGITPVRVFGAASDTTQSEAAEFATGEISHADVVVTTTGCIYGNRFSHSIFRVVLIDEAGQCVDPEIVQAVLHGCQVLILVGDQNQLGPLARCRECARGSYSSTLMLRLLKNGFKPTLLKTQYRMHPAIAKFASDEFYRGLVRDGVDNANPAEKWIPWPNRECPIMFWNVQGDEEFSGGVKSMCNREEAKAVFALLTRVEQAGVEGKDVAVVTPYLGQVEYILDTLEATEILGKDFAEAIEVNTVDAFQGREKEFVIFCCVRANPEKEIGFLNDNRRMNVALTRARKGLVIIGNANAFRKSPTWTRLVQYCMGLGALVEGRLENLTRAVFVPDAAKEEVPEEGDP
jgi:regulator of nonsense transcripts 1